jgi:protein gp37
MGEDTAVEYVRHSFSPWWGCARKSPGCVNCFADDSARRWGYDDLWRRHGPRRVVSDAQWRRPRRWNETARQSGQCDRVLCGTMCDVFEDHPAVAEPRRRLFGLVEETPWLNWLFFTKRIENVNDMVPWGADWPANAWLVPSVEDQERADERIPLLLATAAPVKCLSCEPQLEPLDLSEWIAPHRDVTDPYLDAPDGARVGGMERHGGRWSRAETLIDWVIIGGESGKRARPAHPAWVSDLRDQCREGQVPAWFKQWGTWGPAPWRADQEPGESDDAYRARAESACATHSYPQQAYLDHHHLIAAPGKPWSPERQELPPSDAPMRRWGKIRAGHLLDGRAVTELPAAAFITP